MGFRLTWEHATGKPYPFTKKENYKYKRYGKIFSLFLRVRHYAYHGWECPMEALNEDRLTTDLTFLKSFSYEDMRKYLFWDEMTEKLLDPNFEMGSLEDAKKNHDWFMPQLISMYEKEIEKRNKEKGV